jgi:hypothetical protein
LKKYVCDDILRMDDASPVVVQLRSGDKSETHSVSIFQGRIYDDENDTPSVRTAEPPVLPPGTTQRELPDYIPSGRC